MYLNKEELDNWDYHITFIYFIFHLLLFIIYHFNLIDRNFIKEFYFIIGIISTFLVFDVFSIRFRKMKMFLIWITIGVIQLFIYYKFRKYYNLKVINGTYIDWLKGVPAALIVSFILNSINNRIFGDHFIVTTFRLKADEIVSGETRKLRPTDYLFSIIGFLFIVLIVMI